MLLETALMFEILKTNPRLSYDVARSYASETITQASAIDLDPWILHTIVHIESRWTAHVVREEHNGTCSIGLGQINIPRCGSEEAVRLKDPKANLAATAAFLGKIRRLYRHRGPGLYWLKFYNAGNPRYVGRVLALVERAHARYAESPRPLSDVPLGVHVAGVSRHAAP